MAFMILTHMHMKTKHQENLKLNNPKPFSLKNNKESSNCRVKKKPIALKLKFEVTQSHTWHDSKKYRNILNAGFLVKDRQGSLKTQTMALLNF